MHNNTIKTFIRKNITQEYDDHIQRDPLDAKTNECYKTPKSVHFWI